ncbi:MAG: hypothetical protein KF901_04645 [Myxococcales bacterium]|nr:hypothetical protein [Myxococcales bacterium]
METFLKVIGVALILFGVILLFDAFGVFRFDHPLVTWHFQWGPNAAWAVRGGMIALGLTLVFATPTGDRR